MATLTVQVPGEDGGITFASAAGGGDVFPNDGKTYVAVTNGSGGSITVTITAQTTSTSKDGFGPVTKADGGGSVADGATDIFGPFPSGAFNNSSGQVEVEYSSATSVTVAAFR